MSFVYVLITELLSQLGYKVMYGNFDPVAAMEQMSAGEMPELPAGSFFGQFLYQAMMIMSMVIGAGFSYYTLLISRRIKAGVGDMFDIFTIFLRALGLVMLQALYIFLWALLFVIPGIVAAYRYSMAIYIMLDRPDVSIVDCIRLSKEMTYGNKGKLFGLDMSFILWPIASSLVIALLEGSPILGIICGGIINMIYLPYSQISIANAYNRLSNWQPEAEAFLDETKYPNAEE